MIFASRPVCPTTDGAIFMNMKKTIILVLAAAMSLASCSREGVNLFRGNYSFKTSGTMTATVTVADTVETRTEEMTVSVVTEQGQMDILAVDADEGTAIITMNVLAGDVYTMDAVADGEELSIEPFERMLDVTLTGIGKVTVPVTVEGTAHRYSNVVIFDLAYIGSTETEVGDYDVTLEITSTAIQCVAKLNE